MRSELTGSEPTNDRRSSASDGVPSCLRMHLDASGPLTRFLKLASWSLVAFVLEKGAQALTIVLLARILGAADYGRITLAQGMVNTAQVFIVLGAGTILARYIPTLVEESFERAVEIVNLCIMVILGTATLVAFAGVMGSSAVAVSLLDLPPNSSIPFWIIAWVLLIAANGILFTIMLSLEEGKVVGIVSLAVAPVMISTVSISASRWGFQGAVVAFVIVEIVKALLLSRSYFRILNSRGVTPWLPPRRSDAPILFSFGLPVFLSSALWASTMWLAQIILKQLSPDGLSAVGVFGFCNNILGLVILISSVTNRAAFPILSSLEAKGDGREVRKFVSSMLSIQLVAALAIGGPIAIFSKQIMTSMGSTFAEGSSVLIVMVISGVVISGQQPLINLLLIKDRAIANLTGMAIWSATLLALSFAFADMGALGIAYGVLAAATIKGVFVVVAVASGSRRRAVRGENL